MQLTEVMHQLQELMTTFESSFAGNQEQRSAEAEFAPVVDAIIEPAMQMCTQSAALLADVRYVHQALDVSFADACVPIYHGNTQIKSRIIRWLLAQN